MTATIATTVQLFVSTTDTDTMRTTDNCEDYATVTEAFADLITFTQEEGWTITPEIEDGKIVYRLAGEDLIEGMATIG